MEMMPATLWKAVQRVWDAFLRGKKGMDFSALGGKRLVDQAASMSPVRYKRKFTLAFPSTV
jgi:hypothetical protein